jgi:activator of 2-hydroxyglutaryl-CoA dehydratase
MTPLESPTCVTGGFDIGARTAKMAILFHRGAASVVVAQAEVQLAGNRDVHDARAAIRETWRQLLAEASLSAADVDNMASTGAGARQVVRVGHLYGHSVQALGARLLFPDATVALEVDGAQIHCAVLKDRGRRRAQTPYDDHPPGELVRRVVQVYRNQPSAPSVGQPLPDCLEARAARLLGSLARGAKVVLTGPIVLDAGFVQRLWTRLIASQSNVSLLLSPEGIFAGAYGAAILAARRFTRISEALVPPFADPIVVSPPAWSDRSLN